MAFVREDAMTDTRYGSVHTATMSGTTHSAKEKKLDIGRFDLTGTLLFGWFDQILQWWKDVRICSLK